MNIEGNIMKKPRLILIGKKARRSSSRINMALIVDHGGYTVKVGHSTSQGPELVQNCICKSKYDHRSSYIGNQLNSMVDKASLYINYPVQKGYIVKWEYQKQVWDYLFNSNEFEFDLQDQPVIFTEPIANFNSVRECTLEILFEDYNIQKIHLTTSPILSFYNHSSGVANNFSDKAALIVDSGFSFTHIVPVFEGKICTNGVVRVDVGGKLMTNYLKEIVSFRHMNILNEPYIANQIKEDVCRVSPSFIQELESMSNNNPIKYILPDFHQHHRGYIKGPKYGDTHGQFLNITNEAIVVPELLFNPSIIGLEQIGLSDAITYSINQLPLDLRPLMYANIVINGGNSLFKNFKERVFDDIRGDCPDFLTPLVEIPENPIIYAWEGGKHLLQKLSDDTFISKSEYDEFGSSRLGKMIYDINYHQENTIKLEIVT